MDRFGDILTIWGPMILLLVIYSFFMTRMRSPQNQTIEYLKEQTELMKEFVKITERIATALEKTESKQGGIDCNDPLNEPDFFARQTS
jgi:hypothetical protein